MKIIKSLVLSLSFLFVLQSTAQATKFGKVTKEELKATEHFLEPEAEAAILYQKGVSFIRFNTVTQQMELTYELYRKIKIYDAKASDLANFSLEFYDGESSERISAIHAVTYNLEGNSIVESKLSKKDIYTEKVNDHLYKEKFALPNVKEGSIIEVEYKFTSPFLNTLPTYRFQYNIPVNESFFKIEIPEYFQYNINFIGSFPITQQTKGGSGSFRVSNSDRNGEFSLSDAGNDINYRTLNYTTTRYTFTAENIPSLKAEPYLLSIEDYQQAVMFSLSSVNIPYSNNDYISKDWNSIATLLNKSSEFGSELNKNYNEYKEFISSLETFNNLEKLKKILHKVQTDFTWNGVSNRYVDQGIKSLIKEKVGSSTEINLLLVNLLQEAGVNAKPLITKPRKDGILRLKHPGLSDLTYVIATAVVGEKVYYLDATYKFSSIHCLPTRAININGIILDENNGVETNIKNPNVFQNQILKTVNLDKDLALSVSETEKKTNISASLFREKIHGFSENKKLIEKLEEETKGLNIDSISFDNRFDNELPIIIQTHYKLKNKVEQIDDKLFVKIPIDLFITTNPFKSQQRDFAIFYPSKEKINTVITFKVPEGYEIESLPESTKADIEVANFTYFVQKSNDQTVLISTSFNVKETIIASNYYDYLKKLYDLVLEKSNEAIVLKKI